MLNIKSKKIWECLGVFSGREKQLNKYSSVPEAEELDFHYILKFSQWK